MEIRNEKKFQSIAELKEQFLMGELEVGVYSALNEENQGVVIVVNSNGFEIQTNQTNGWVRIDDYTYEKGEWTKSETYGGKWKQDE